MKAAFVVGCYRSGTTLMRVMLDQSSLIHAPPETGCLHRLLAEFGNRQYTVTHPVVRRWYDVIFRSCLSQGWAAIPSFTEVITELGKSACVSQLFATILELDAARCGKSSAAFWCDNSPVYVLALHQLAAAFSEIKVIVLVRDPRDVYCSVRKTAFASCFNPVAFGYEWTERMAAACAAERFLGADGVTFVRYEDLVNNPGSILRAVCSFLGIPFDSRMVRFHESKAAADTALQPHHRSLVRPVFSDSVGKHRTILKEQDRAIIEAICGAQMRAFGYPLEASVPVYLSNVSRYAYLARNFLRLVASRAYSLLIEHI